MNMPAGVANVLQRSTDVSWIRCGGHEHGSSVVHVLNTRLKY